MKAIGFYHPGPISAADALVELKLPAPKLQPRDLLVRVEAISVNPVDVKVRASAQPPKGTPRILGYDAVGIVEAVGPEATLFKKGDAVFYAGIRRPDCDREASKIDRRGVGAARRSGDD